MARGDLQSSAAIYAKGLLLLCLACLSGGLLLAENFTIKAVILLGICLWSACRSYYFAFYVIEKYVDPGFKFAGLIDFARYLLGRPRK